MRKRFTKILPIYILLNLFLSHHSIFPQIIEEKIIIENFDHTKHPSFNMSIDKEGNYLIKNRENKKNYLIRNQDTLEIHNPDSETNSKNIKINNFINGNGEVLFYFYVNTKTDIFGPFKGELIYSNANFDNNLTAFSVLEKDSVYNYINNKLISIHGKDDLGDKHFYKWFTSASNGNTLFYIYNNSLKYLYKNDSLIDRTEYDFNNLNINNNGDVLYEKTIELNSETNSKIVELIYNGKILNNIKGNASIILFNNGKYLCTYRNINNEEILLTNYDTLFNIPSEYEDYYNSSGDYLLFIKRGGANYVNSKNNEMRIPSDKYFSPQVNRNGEIAFYLIEDYYLYKYINGIKSENPVSNYGVRGVPLYINADGNSIYYFKTNDSIFVYINDTLFFRTNNRSSNIFCINAFEYIVNYNLKSLDKKIYDLKILNIDTMAYILLNGKINNSTASSPDQYYSQDHDFKFIFVSQSSDSTYCIIQKQTGGEFAIFGNNIRIDLKNISELYTDFCYLDEDILTCYLVKNNNLIQLKIRL
ncbi:MAG: hypothetical protein IAE65_08070 [Ignavibacteria bacterium]|nr:hypothetical protein [Ignavibacteria bacterium]